MDYKDIRSILAPCGLDCSRCLGHKDGPIRRHARALHELLGEFDSYAERFSSFVPAFRKYPSFKELLDVLVGADCDGCRDNEKKYPVCSIARCYKDKEFDFCFQCSEYPCSPENIDADLHNRWLAMNDRMRDIGVDAYYEETKDEPRYK